MAMPTLKIRTQIILPFLLLMLILGVIGTYLTTSLVATSLENRIADQLRMRRWTRPSSSRAVRWRRSA